MKHTLGIIISLIFVLLIWPVRTTEAATHPNLYLNQTEINQMKANIASNQEPWKSAYTDFLATANSDLTMPNYSVTDDGGGNEWVTDSPYTSDGIFDPNAHRNDYENGHKVTNAILYLGLAYQTTGQAKYADKAISLMKTFFTDPQKGLKPGTGAGNEIEVWISLPAAFYGIDMIWNYPGFSSADKSAIKNWAQISVNRARNLDICCNNWRNWWLVYIMSLSAVAEDNEKMNFAIGKWKDIVYYTVGNSGVDEGLMVQEVNRTLSLDYSMFGLNAMVQGAEIGRHMGVDLYSYKDSRGKSLESVFDAYVPYLLNPGSWPYEQIRSFDPYNGVYVYELAYHRYGQKNSYKSVINKYGRPMSDTWDMGPTTLTQGLNFSGSLPPVNKPGDTDGNGIVNIFDYNNLVADFGTSNSRSDFDKSGRVDIFDYNALVSYFGR